MSFKKNIAKKKRVPTKRKMTRKRAMENHRDFVKKFYSDVEVKAVIVEMERKNGDQYIAKIKYGNKTVRKVPYNIYTSTDDRVEELIQGFNFDDYPYQAEQEIKDYLNNLGIFIKNDSSFKLLKLKGKYKKLN